MRLIDADELERKIDGRKMCQEQRALFHALVAESPRRGYEEDEVNKMMNENDYWRKHCDLLERTIIKLAIRYTESDGA